ncbi:MAG: CHAT domain-containing protein [Nostoc sp. SerVER01]|nr:CHAT domain-containing tetratricopeptide repeat protein [Nostoc sp. SerVER01]
MEEQPRQAYLDLIIKLWSAASEQEIAETLQTNENLLDSNLMETMNILMEMMIKEGGENDANRLQNMAQWLAEIIRNRLAKLSSVYFQKAQYNQAVIFTKEALYLALILYEEEHLEVANWRHNLAVVYKYLGRFSEAEAECNEALGIKERLLGEEHIEVALSRSALAEIYREQGHYHDAEILIEKALKMAKRLGKEYLEMVAMTLNNLATLYLEQGRLNEAESKCEEALAIAGSLGESQLINVATILNNQATIFQKKGLFKNAESQYLQALKLTKYIRGEEDVDVATTLNNLATFYRQMGRLNEAEDFYKKALGIIKRLLGDNHFHVAAGLNNLAGLYKSQGHFQQAEDFYQQALQITKLQRGEQHPDVALMLNNLAGLYNFQGRFQEAEDLYQEALAMIKQQLGENHPSVAASLSNLATLLAADNRPTQALECMTQASLIEDIIIRQVFAASSERDRFAYLRTIKGQFDGFLSLVYNYLSNSPTAVQAAFDLILKRKALIASSVAAQNYALYSGRYPHLAEDFLKLLALSDQLVHLAFSPPQAGDNTTYEQNWTQLSITHNNLQKFLASQVPEIQLQEQPTDSRAVALELPEGSTLVEFVRFDVFNFQTLPGREEAQWQPERYLAFVLPAGQPDAVQMIDLGAAETIDNLIQEFLLSVAPEENNSLQRLDFGDWDEDLVLQPIKYNPAAAIKLYGAIFNPIRAVLPECQHLILAPDGNLNLVPFQILPIDETTGQLLMDEYTISYLSVGRDILRSKVQPTHPASAPLVIADPDFDLGANSVDQREASTPAIPQQLTLAGYDSATLGSALFSPAPGTRFLGESVAKKLKQAELYLGAQALETRLTTSQCPSIMLIATHGLFLPESGLLPGVKEAQEGLRVENRFSGAKLENPMVRSGLALAGANTWLSGGTLPKQAGKGVVFAVDVASLDLWANELTVLSACNTARGDIFIGEGVFGLRRAFAMAGVKTLIMSLWSVPDKATALLMECFFDNLQRGLGRSEALQSAQNYLRTVTVEELQQSPLGIEVLKQLLGIKELHSQTTISCQESKPLQHPLYWGAWVCQGDTTALKEPELLNSSSVLSC